MTGKKIVFSDIDGTLLNSKSELTELNLIAINSLKEKNIPFVLVSARSPECIYPILEEYGFNCNIIGLGGAIIVNESRDIIYENGLSKKLAKDVSDFINQYGKNIVVNFYSGDKWIVNDKENARVKTEEKIVKVESIEGTIDDIDKSVHKILCMGEEDNILEIEEYVKKNFEELTVVKSSASMLEIMNTGINKGKACEILCKLWDIEVKDCIAFGDNYNDLDMLLTVGRGYIMNNAPTDLKNKVKNLACSNDESGFYKKLKDIGII